MTRKTLAVAVAGLAIVALAMGPAAAGRKVVARYVGGMPAGGGFLPQSGPSFTLPEGHPNIGGVWMLVPAGSGLMDVTVDDDVSSVVAADVVFVVDEYGPLFTSKRFCGSAKGIPIAAGAKALYVRVVDLGSLACSPPGVPTMGTITVIFR